MASEKKFPGRDQACVTVRSRLEQSASIELRMFRRGWLSADGTLGVSLGKRKRKKEKKEKGFKSLRVEIKIKDK